MHGCDWKGVTRTQNSKSTKTKTNNLTQSDATEDTTSPNQAVLVKAQRVYRISGKPNLAIFWLFWTIGKVKQRRKRKPLTDKPGSDYQLMRTRGGFPDLLVRTNWITRFEGKRRRWRPDFSNPETLHLSNRYTFSLVATPLRCATPATRAPVVQANRRTRKNK